MAVYTDIPDAELTHFVAEYEIGAVLACKGIAEGVENTNFMLQTEYGHFVLTIYEKRVNPDDLPFFVGLMDHLASRDITCPTPVAARDGRALRTLVGKPALIATFLEGMWPRTIQPYHCRGVGETLANLHLAGADFGQARANDLSVAGWRRLIEKIGVRADEVEAGLAAELEREIGFLAGHWPAALPQGVIHADLFPDNLFFRGEHVSGVIDFYFACTDALAYDLAICLNAWCFDAEGGFQLSRAADMIAAYRAVRPLSAAEIAALPVLARGAAMRFLLTRLHDWVFRQEGVLVRPKDPREYLTKLRFHRGVAGPAEYGVVL